MDSSLRPYFQTMIILLMLCPLVLGVSVQRITSSEASHVLQDACTNSCSIIVCGSDETSLQEKKDLQRQVEELRAFVIKLVKVILTPYGAVLGKMIYKADPAVGDFYAANATCSEQGSTLASPRNPAENGAIQKIVAFLDKKAILGINDMTVEGRFEYLNGEYIQYSNWAPGEPNNVGNEDCVEMHPDGQWHDTACDSIHGKSVICQFKI